MFSLTRPSEDRVRALLARGAGLACSYPDVGATAGEPPAGYVVDCNRVRLGEGPDVFRRACDALRDWAMFRVGWAEVWPPGAPIEVGAAVAILARGLGVWAAFACRIVE